jgi:hypothetical protein
MIKELLWFAIGALAAIAVGMATIYAFTSILSKLLGA